jgi:hypothetical protein
VIGETTSLNSKHLVMLVKTLTRHCKRHGLCENLPLHIFHHIMRTMCKRTSVALVEAAGTNCETLNRKIRIMIHLSDLSYSISNQPNVILQGLISRNRLFCFRLFCPIFTPCQNPRLFCRVRTKKRKTNLYAPLHLSQSHSLINVTGT